MKFDYFFIAFIATLAIMAAAIVGFLPVIMFVLTRRLRWFFLYLLIAPTLAGVLNMWRNWE